MFVTLTYDSYGCVRQDGTPVGPQNYDYQRAARDAVHFASLGGPVVAKPAPGSGLGRPVLRHRRAPKAGSSAPAHHTTGIYSARGDPSSHRTYNGQRQWQSKRFVFPKP